MVLRLDPTIPLVWRTPHALQLGVERDPLVLDPVSRAEEILVEALRRGAARSALEVFAGQVEPERRDVLDGLLERLGPRVIESRETAPEPDLCLVFGSTPLARRIAGALPAPSGNGTGSRRPLGLAVLVGDWALAPGEAVEWMSRDIAHLPVVAADGTVVIGPVVRPGQTACLYCLHRHRTDADPAWPAIAAQLLARPTAPISPLGEVHAAVIVARAALRAAMRRDEPGVQWRLDTGSGELTAIATLPHPECACGAHPESGWARDAVPLRPAGRRTAPPRSATAGAGLG